MSNPPRLRFIDSLRGLAALYIVIFHMCFVPEFLVTVPPFIRPFVLNGGTGVLLFFVISAFTLCYSFNKKADEKNRVTSFYIRRVFRIVPLYYVWLLVICFLMFGFDIASGVWLNKKSFLLYSLFGFNFFPGKQEGWVLASWTLGVEVIFYLFFPVIFRFCKNLKRSLIFFMITLFISLLHYKLTRHIPEYNFRRGILYQLPVFSIGIISYHIIFRIDKNHITAKSPLLLIVGSIGSIILIPYFHQIFKMFGIEYITAIAYGGLLVGLSMLHVRLLVNRVTNYFGLISYSLYLNHPLLVRHMGEIYQRIYACGLSMHVLFLIFIMVTLLPLTILSFITYYLIEKPGIKIGRRFIKEMKEKILSNNLKLKN